MLDAVVRDLVRDVVLDMGPGRLRLTAPISGRGRLQDLARQEE
jgi:hypothetical protein